MTKNCAVCYFYQYKVLKAGSEITYAEKPSCLSDEVNDTEYFDIYSERSCCDFDFWKILKIDEEIGSLFLNDEDGLIYQGRAYKRFLEKYSN